MSRIDVLGAVIFKSLPVGDPRVGHLRSDLTALGNCFSASKISKGHKADTGEG